MSDTFEESDDSDAPRPYLDPALKEFPSSHTFTGRFHRRRPLRRDIRSAHRTASARLRDIDTDLEEVLARRFDCLDELARYRRLLNRRYSDRHGGRRPAEVDEPPMPPAPAGADPLHGVDLRAVAVTILRRHGPQRLRDLHGLIHCYGYVVASTRPVQRLADAMAYEQSRGRTERLARGVYGATSPHPGPTRSRGRRTDLPEVSGLGTPLPWQRPDTEPWPPFVDPLVASDPEHWSSRGWPLDPDPDSSAESDTEASPEHDSEPGPGTPPVPPPPPPPPSSSPSPLPLPPPPPPPPPQRPRIPRLRSRRWGAIRRRIAPQRRR